MNILVLNGSPKGKNSVTLQTVRYWELLFSDQDFDILHVGQTIKALEKDFSPALAAIEKADVLLFTYPVYTFLASCQLHRFIELLKDSGADLSGKYASQLTTSKHFYDITAHRYIQDNCDDLGLHYIKGVSADMEDLIWLMQGMMRADHKFYKAHKQYDFPQKQRPKMLTMYLVGAMMNNQKLKTKMGNAMTDGMLMPYQKVLDQVKKTVPTLSSLSPGDTFFLTNRITGNIITHINKGL